MPTTVWGPELADRYDLSSRDMFDPAVLGPTVDFLAEQARGGRALELAIGTGRVGLALSARGVDVEGIELSPYMAEKLTSKPGAERVPVTVGDMATTRVVGEFRLVYLVFNTICNVTTQAEQVAVFANAAAHLEPGGRFVIECQVPDLAKLPPGERARVFSITDEHVGVDTYDDLVAQILSSHHWLKVGDRWVRSSGSYRYVWPSELDLMAQLARMRLVERWADWRREPFTGESGSHVSVWEKPL